MSKIEQWLNSAVGRGMNPDNTFGYQCKDVADDYCIALFGNWTNTIRPGDAKVAFAKSNPDYFVKVTNQSDNYPPRGAIICWNENMGGGFGHIAVILSADVNTFSVVEQNGFQNTKPAYIAHYKNYANVIGWLIPKVQEENMPSLTTAAEVDAIYQIVLGRSTQGDPGSQGWVGKPWPEVFSGVANSQEARNYRDTRASLADTVNRQQVVIQEQAQKLQTLQEEVTNLSHKQRRSRKDIFAELIRSLFNK